MARIVASQGIMRVLRLSMFVPCEDPARYKRESKVWWSVPNAAGVNITQYGWHDMLLEYNEQALMK